MNAIETVSRLNSIHDLWMAFDSTDHSPKRDRILKLMKEVPSSHLSVSPDKKVANVMIHTLPVYSKPIPIGEAIEYAKKRGIRTDIAWCGSLEPKAGWVIL